MNRTVIVLGLALLVAAIAPGRSGELKATAAPAISTEITATENEQTGLRTIATGRMSGFAYMLQFIQPDGLTGAMVSSQVFPDLWDGAAIDRIASVQMVEQAGVWDSVNEGTQIKLYVPEDDIETITVTLDPNTTYTANGQPQTDYPTYAPKSINMMPDANGELHTCSFPISFQSDDGADYSRLFCTIQVTFRNGNRCEIACGLAKKA